MTNVVVTITKTSISVPASIVGGNYRYILTGVSNTQLLQLESSNDTVTFSDVPEGDYIPSCARLDSNGNVIGTELTGSQFTIAPATTTVDVPATITISLA